MKSNVKSDSSAKKPKKSSGKADAVDGTSAREKGSMKSRSDPSRTVLFTTVVRAAPLSKGGELVKVDWERKRVTARAPLVPRGLRIVDKNPRGNARGGRGIRRWNGAVVAATYHTLYLFDEDLKRKGRITHPLFVGMHEMAVDGDLLWITSTAIDGALAIDKSGELCESWWPRETPQLQASLGLRPARINKSKDNRLLWLGKKNQRNRSHVHLNALAAEPGRLYALLNRFGVIYDVRKDRIVVQDRSIIGSHNLVLLDKSILVLDTRAKRIVFYTHRGRKKREIDLLKFDPIASIHAASSEQSSSMARPLFLRGLCPIGDGRLLVGFSPATIAEIDVENEKLESVFQYSEDLRVSVHGLYSEGV